MHTHTFGLHYPTRTYAYAHTNKAKKKKSHVKHRYNACHPVNQSWDACALLRSLSFNKPQENCPSLMERGCRTIQYYHTVGYTF